jgi:hypothetical protein
MARKGRAKLRKLIEVVEQVHPEVADARQAILARTVLVNGLVVDNPESLVRSDASVVTAWPKPLRAEVKLVPKLLQLLAVERERFPAPRGSPLHADLVMLARLSQASSPSPDEKTDAREDHSTPPGRR